MSDALYDNLCESWKKMEESSIFLTEAKKKFPHLSENVILEHKEVIANINLLSVSAKSIMNTFGISFEKARILKKSYDSFAIAEYYARTENDAEIFNEKLNRACGVILLEDKIPNPDGDFPNAMFLGKQPKLQRLVRGVQKPELPQPAEPDINTDQKAETKKKSFLSTVKDFLIKAGQFVKTVATSSTTYKVLAIGAVMVVLGVVAATIGGWAAVGFSAIKGVLGLVSIFKGSKELMKTSDFAQGKKGIDGVKQWIKTAKDPKNAARIMLAISQVALGAWGASSAVGEAMKEIAVMDAMKAYNPNGATQPVAPQATQQSTPQATQPVTQQAAPEAPKPVEPQAAPQVSNQTADTAATVPSTDLAKYSSYGAAKAEAMQAEFQKAVLGPKGSVQKFFNAFGEKIGEAVTNGAIDKSQAEAVIRGYAETMHEHNGSIPTEMLINKLLAAASIK